ncbi:MAG TPA: hypothetical protein PLW61_07575 [Caldisericia bacterium]|nr:hypothetical protein [Caldisericia bacterium]
MNDNKVYYDWNEIDLTKVVKYERRELMGNYYLYLVDIGVDWAGIPIPEHLKKFSPIKRIPTFIEIDEEDLK